MNRRLLVVNVTIRGILSFVIIINFMLLCVFVKTASNFCRFITLAIFRLGKQSI